MDESDRPLIPMEVGLRLDVLDNDGIWNTGAIVDVSRDNEDMVEIKYDGWGDEYNEWITLSSQRLAPLHLFTMVKKCWAKLTKWPWWPAFVVLRAPTRKAAADALNAESKIYVEFFDSYSEDKRSRCWMQKKNISSFDEGFDEKASKNIGKNFPEYVEGAQRALAGGTPVLFAGNGTLPIEFSSKYSEPLATRKMALTQGDESKWYEAYHIFSNRYRLLYGFDYAKDPAKGLMAAQGKHAKSAKAKIAAALSEDEDEDDDDEVEIIEPEQVKPKRGPGRPPGKQAKKQPPPTYEDEEEDEEEQEEESDGKEDGDDYKDTGDDDDEEEEEEEDDEEPESPRGRRSSRVASKRKSLESPPTRSSRPRRAKDDEAKDQDEDDDMQEDHSFQADEEDQSMDSDPAPPAAKSPRIKHVRRRLPMAQRDHKRTALSQLLAATPPQRIIPFQRARTPADAALVQEIGKAIGVVDGGSPVSRSPELKPGSRRKSTTPQSLSSPARSKRASPLSPGNTVYLNEDGSSPLRHWTGFGAIEEAGGPRKPFTIQNWLITGYRRKQSSEGNGVA